MYDERRGQRKTTARPSCYSRGSPPCAKTRTLQPQNRMIKDHRAGVEEGGKTHESIKIKPPWPKLTVESMGKKRATPAHDMTVLTVNHTCRKVAHTHTHIFAQFGTGKMINKPPHIHTCAPKGFFFIHKKTNPVKKRAKR